MKQMLFILLLLVSIGMLVAVESAPSAVVGYYKLNAPQDSWTAISVPFFTPTGTPTEVFGTQFANNDFIFDPFTGASTTYYDGFGWFPDDPGFVTPGHFYYVNRVIDNPTTDYYVLGTVNPQGFTLTVSGQDFGGWTPFSLNEARNITLDALAIPTLVADDVNGLYDTILDLNTGRTASYYGPGVGWFSSDGLDFFIEPTHAYYFNSNNATGFDWTYTPGARSASHNPTINTSRSAK